MGKPSEGYREIDHTADWALHVWAHDLESLFGQAALGMYALAETVLQTEPRITRRIKIETRDLESLIVGFLNELLFISEQDIYGFDTFDISVKKYKLSGEISGSQIISQKKEIKAVTYHALEIKHSKNGFEVQIVFDV
ncbi:MAG: archease [Chloroflexi bacterium]|nr:archease [Chloroflexota bacterium]